MSRLPTAKPTLNPDILYPLDNEKISTATFFPFSEDKILGFLASKPNALYAKS